MATDDVFERQRQETVELLEAHGVDPGSVPKHAPVTVTSQAIEYEEFVRGEDGNRVPSGMYPDTWATVSRTIPLQVTC